MPDYRTLSNYIRYIDLVTAFSTLAGEYPNLAEVVNLPKQTYDGNLDVPMLVIGTAKTNPGVLFTGGVHAREWGSTEICLCLAADLLYAYSSNTGLTFGAQSFNAAQVASILENLTVFLVPMANPDGREYDMNTYPTQNTDPGYAGWRGNRNLSNGATRGVDLNRNQDFLWNYIVDFAPGAANSGTLASDTPGSDIYHGASVQSEPEAQNIASLFASYPTISWYIDIHSFDGAMLYSWGDDQDQSDDPSMNFQNPSYNGQRGLGATYGEYISPADLEVVKQAATRFTTAANAAGAGHYLALQDCDLWGEYDTNYSLYHPGLPFVSYPVSGANGDYAASLHFVDDTAAKVFGFTLEWGYSDEATGSLDFHPPWSDMAQIVTEVDAGLVSFCLNAVEFAAQSCSLVFDRSRFGKDEIDSYPNDTATFIQAFWVVFEGFKPSELGFSSPADLSSPQAQYVPTITMLTDATGAQETAIHNMISFPNNDFSQFPVEPSDPTLPDVPLTFSYPCSIKFTGDAGFSAVSEETLTVVATLTLGATTFVASGDIELDPKAEPHFQNVVVQANGQLNSSWLSADLRFFKVTGGANQQVPFNGPAIHTADDAPACIATIIDNLNTGMTGGQTFESLPTDEQTSKLEYLPTDNQMNAIYNFAVAHVHMRGDAAPAIAVRVFFRLFQAQTTNSTFDPATTYRTYSDGVLYGHKIPLMGVQTAQSGGSEYVTIPCFATTRINRFDPADLRQQYDVPNVQLLNAGQNLDAYFGCWLDTNQPSQSLLPATPAGQANPTFGPFTGTLQSIHESISLAPHQCLIAEICFDDAPIPTGPEAPNTSTSDQLAQRNIAWVDGP
jgi:murein tripeptide amidase MpaA